jgi:hypothetical protein
MTALLSLSAFTACGGQSQSSSGEPMGASAAAGSGTSGASGSGGDLTSSGGTQSESGGPPDSGAASEAGTPGYVSLIDSGTRICDNEDYCFGLTCYAPATFVPTVCVARCETDANCLPFEACVQSAKLDPTCYPRCASPSDCYDGFDCFDFSGTGRLVCFPTNWASRRSELD